MFVVMADRCEEFSDVMVVQAVEGVPSRAAHRDEPRLTEESKLM